MIRLCIEPPNDTPIWEAAEDAISLSYQVGGTEVILLLNGVLVRVKSGRNTVVDVFNAYESRLKNGKTQQAVR